MENRKPQILAIIPARSGSKGIPGKNARLLGGKPLIHYTFASASEALMLDRIMLSTDSEQIRSMSTSFPRIQALPLRPAALAQDATPMIDILSHVIQYCDKKELSFDYVCLLQPTCPFRNPGLIDQTIMCLIGEHADSLVTVRKIPTKYNPHWAYEKKAGFMVNAMGENPPVSRRQELPEAWFRDGQIYITRTDLIRKGLLQGEKLIGFPNDASPDINMDTIADWIQAENFVTNGFTS